MASGATPLLAVIVKVYAARARGGVPARVAVPLPLSVNFTPLGSAPLSRERPGEAVVGHGEGAAGPR